MTAVSATAGGQVPDVDARAAVATLPSPLYGLYRTRDHLSALTIAVVFAIFAASTIAVLLIGRLVTGVSVGLAAGTAITYLIELRVRADPGASSAVRARTIGTSDLLIALYVGLSVPVIGAGIALDLGASPPDTVLGFAVLVGLGVVLSGWALAGRNRGARKARHR